MCIEGFLFNVSVGMLELGCKFFLNGSLKNGLCLQICVIQNGNLDAPQRSTCVESSVIEQITLKKFGLVPESPGASQENKPSQFWNFVK